jgi:glycosyltransferase involved in cell wall biosynthesis
MTNDTKRILVVFGDSSLGGTSRSALLSGYAWIQAGYEVDFLPFVPIASARLPLFEDAGAVLDLRKTVRLADYDLIHLHHPAWSKQASESTLMLIELARDQDAAPPLLTNNVFGVRDKILDRWPGVRAVGVLGTWSALQYRFSMGVRRGRQWPWIIPNPQNTDFFRPPTETERQTARARWGLADGQSCILRIGSPNSVKWSESYVELAKRAEHLGHTLILVGCPPELRARIKSSAVRYPELTADDNELRSLYWAADVFSLNAERGESFGNVILESLACHTAVVYRSRVLRDNTPWEFQELPGFHYVDSDKAWALISCSPELWREQEKVEAASQIVKEKYSVARVAAIHSKIVETLTHSSLKSVFASTPPSILPHRIQLAAILLTNNTLIASVKERRLRKAG